MKPAVFFFTVALMFCFSSFAQQNATTSNGTIGKMPVATFNSMNAKGAATVKAIKPTKAALSAADQSLFMQVALGGQKQLAISQAALAKVSSPQAKLLASSEVEEQTTLSAKLQEIADAKGITLPPPPDTLAQTVLTRMQDLSGSALDAFYVSESGVKGHEELEKTMVMVNSSAKDATLKQLASATLPVIRTHLSVSRDVAGSMTGTKDSAMK